MPAYVQTTLTTGMSMSGKMSTGMRTAAPTPKQGHQNQDRGDRVGSAEDVLDDAHGSGAYQRAESQLHRSISRG